MENKINVEKMKNGWEYGETKKHQQPLRNFLKDYFQKKSEAVDDLEKEKEIDYGYDLEFSGNGGDVWAGIRSGTLLPKKISVFYEEGKIKKINGYFETQSNGHNLDVYLTEKALSDYLEKFYLENN